MDPETLYVIRTDPPTYVRTPDGVGAYWYTEDEHGPDYKQMAKEDICTPTRTSYFDSELDFFNWRYA